MVDSDGRFLFLVDLFSLVSLLAGTLPVKRSLRMSLALTGWMTCVVSMSHIWVNRKKIVGDESEYPLTYSKMENGEFWLVSIAQ